MVSLRQFTINAFNQHLGMQATERFRIDTDPDGDGITNELTRADITAITVFQAVLPLDREGWVYTEPNLYNPPGNLHPGEAPTLSIDLTAVGSGGERLKPRNGAVMVPLYADVKLHDICRSADDPNREVLNQNAAAGSESFFQGNPKFLTRRLWAVGSKPNYFHHGQFTTIREAILNADGSQQ